MEPLRPRRPAHRGTVLAAGIVVDARLSADEQARSRVLRELVREGGTVDRLADSYVVRFRRDVLRRSDVAGGTLLVRHGRWYAGLPLEADERKRLLADNPSLSLGSEHVVLADGGTATVHALEGEPVDVAIWLDVSSFLPMTDVSALGDDVGASIERAVPVSKDVRSALGAPPTTGEGERLLAALTTMAPSPAPSTTMTVSSAHGPRSSSAMLFPGLVARTLSVLVAFLDKWTRLASKPGASRSPTHGPALADRVSRWFERAAARLLVWARLGPWLGRKHAAYLSGLLDAFERGDVDEVLRRGIPMNGDEDAVSGSEMALSFAERQSFEIRLAKKAQSTSVALGPTLFSLLKEKYRALATVLAERGEIDKAAFVLAELLQATEEAVAFLQKHRRYVLAAQLAEARELPPGIVVRAWFLAGDKERAISIARRTSSFAEAVHLLERSDAGGARALRMLWAEVLADQGAFGAAVEVVWSITEARSLAKVWLEHAVAAGGATGMRALVKKLVLSPETFSVAHETFRRMTLSDDFDVGLAAMESEIAAHVPNEATRLLAKVVVREALSRMDGGRDDEREARLRKLLDIAADDALRVEVKRTPTRLFAREDGRHVGVRLATSSAPASAKQAAENAAFVSLLDGSAPWRATLTGDVSARGVLFAALDGVGGLEGAEGSAATFVARHVWERLRAAHVALDGSIPSCDQASATLVEACRFANRELLRAKQRQPQLTAMTGGTFATVAGTTLIVAHVGGARAYVLRGRQLTRIVTEHSSNEYRRRRGGSLDAALEQHESMLVSSFGASAGLSCDLVSFELRRGDVVLLCSEGLWRVLDEQRIRHSLVLATCELACADLVAKAKAASAPDDVAIVVAAFDGDGLEPPPSDHVDLTEQLTTFEPAKEAADEKSVSTIHHRARTDVGAISILDAVELPGGGWLLALGELGLRLLSPDGSLLLQFKEPAHRLVLSDHGTRAIVVTKRGESTQLSRLDLVTRRLRPWCDARIDAHATDFDGGIWYVSFRDSLFAIDALHDEWKHLWSVSAMADGHGRIASIERTRSSEEKSELDSAAALAVLVSSDDGAASRWTYETKRHVLRSRTEVPLGPSSRPRAETLVVSAGGAVLDFQCVKAADDTRALVARWWNDDWETLTIPDVATPLVPIGNHEWLVFAARSEHGLVLRVVETRTLRPACEIRLDAPPGGASSSSLPSPGRVHAKLRRNRLVAFDDHGRLLAVALDTGRVLHDLRVS